jgi:PhnB protein
MATINSYLVFNGNCEEAFLFYQSVFDIEFSFLGRFSEMPLNDENCDSISEDDQDKIMHIELPLGNGTVLMGSDSSKESGDVIIGTNFSISINTDSKEEADNLFNGLSVGGNLFMPMNKTFWGAYFGMFVDRFGIQWMVNFDEKQN